MLECRRAWHCRRCVGLSYISQSLSPGERWQRRADALYAKSGSESDDRKTIHKHKWMRWRTLNRLMDKANALLGHADVLFLTRLRRFGFAGVDEAVAEILGEQ